MTAARTLFEGRAVLDNPDLGTADELYMRFARLGLPGYPMPEASPQEAAPAEFAHLMVWYTDLRNRAANGFGGEPVSLEAIEAYRCKLARAGVEMDPLDEDLLARIDNTWRECSAQSSQQTPPAG